MSFTSTPSVRPRTVLALVVELFFIKPTSMENILQSIVKIIIIGSFYRTTNVNGNRQFLPPPPPLPYYQNEGFYLPGFVPSYHEPLPVYYSHHNPSPAISYQNMNSYSPPQLFQQNKNYNPTQFVNPNLRYSMPQLPPYKPNTYQMYKESNFGAAQENKKLPSVAQSPVEGVPKKQAFYATNIIVKEESHSPFYQDDYNKNYQDEDYADNYSDEPSQPEPCVQGRYQYFESSNSSPKEKITLCNPYFQPNFGNSVYTLKMPITLLPSRFPPRVEQLIERIQNYFSTYTQQETPKPQNETITTTVESVTEATNGVGGQSTLAVVDENHKNKTTVTEEPNVEEGSREPVEEATIGTVNEQVTQKTIVVYVQAQDEETFSTAAPDSQATKEPQVTAEIVPITEESTKPTVEHLVVSKISTPMPQQTEEKKKSSENQISNELPHSVDVNTEIPEIFTQSPDIKSLPFTTEMWTKIEESSSFQPTEDTLLQVTDTNG